MGKKELNHGPVYKLSRHILWEPFLKKQLKMRDVHETRIMGIQFKFLTLFNVINE